MGYWTEWGVDATLKHGYGIMGIYRDGEPNVRRGRVRVGYKAAEWQANYPAGVDHGRNIRGTHGGQLFSRTDPFLIYQWQKYASEKAAALIRVLEAYDRGEVDLKEGVKVDGITGMQ